MVAGWSTTKSSVPCQGLVQELLAGLVQGHGVVVGLADIDADEHVDGFMVVDHGAPHS
jgi:hypothetical protein